MLNYTNNQHPQKSKETPHRELNDTLMKCYCVIKHPQHTLLVLQNSSGVMLYWGAIKQIQRSVMKHHSVYVYKKIVIERTSDLIYLKFVATDFSLKIISPSAGENSATQRSPCYSAVSALLINSLPDRSNYSPLKHIH